MQIEYSKQAVKTISNMDTATKNRIRQGINKIPEGDIVPLKNSPGSYRLRVGGWRIIFSYRSDDVILIEKIAPRGDVYKGA